MAHLDEAVPHLENKLTRFYSLSNRLDVPKDRAALVQKLTELGGRGFSAANWQKIIPPNPEVHGSIEHHQAIVECFLGERSWPFPEYLDLEGRDRDEDLTGFHHALDERFRLYRFVATGTENSNRNMEFNQKFLSAQLKDKPHQNALSLSIAGGILACEGPEEGDLAFEHIANISLKDITVEVSSNYFDTLFESEVGHSESKFQVIPADGKHRFRYSNQEPIPENDPLNLSTPWMAFSKPADDEIVYVEITAGLPHVEIVNSAGLDPKKHKDILKIARAHLNNELERSSPEGLYVPIQNEFPVYVMSYKPHVRNT